MCTCKDKTVDTIFYFAPTKAEYNALYIGNEIDARTITFVAETGEIWKNGVLYGKMSEADLKNMIQKITEENPYILPIATKDDADNAHIGGVMGGKYITVNTKNGSISIDVNKLFSDPIVKNLIEKVITQELIENKYTPAVADYDKLGIVSVKRDGGITIKNGVISIDGDNLPDGLQGKDGATPTIGSDGYWYINGKNTGVKAKGEKGDKGDAGTGGGVSGKYIVNIIPWYCLSNDKTTAPTSGWTTTSQEVDADHLYLWRKEQLVYNDTTSSWTSPYLANQWVKGDRGETGPGGGFNPQEDTYIQEIYNLAYNNYLLGQSLIDGEINRIQNLVNAIDEEIQQRVVNMLDEAGVIQAGAEGEIQPVYTFGMEDVGEWLAQLGFWEYDKEHNVVTRWSKIQQAVDQIELSTNVLREFTDDQIQALQSFLRVFSDDTEAGHELASFLADLNDQQQIVRWLYSGITGKAIEGKTWEDMISAARDVRIGQAASKVHTEVSQNLFGEFIANSSLISLVENTLHTKLAAAGIISQSQNDWALSETFSRVQDVFEDDGYANLNATVQTISDMLDEHNPYTQSQMIADTTIYQILTEPVTKDGKTYTVPKLDQNGNIQYVLYDGEEGRPEKWEITDENGWRDGDNVLHPVGSVVDTNPGAAGRYAKVVKSSMRGGFITTANVKDVMTTMFAENTDGIKTEIIASINENNERTIELNSDTVTVTGDIDALHSKLQTKNIITETLEAGTATFEGNVKAKQFVAGDEDGTNITVTDKAICFNYQDDTRAWFSAYDATGTNVTQGMNLYIRDPQDHDNVITIDFLNLTFKAVNGNSTDVALPLYSLRNITNSSPINTTQTLYYSSSTGKYYTTPAGTLLATIGGGYYKQDGGKLVLIKDTSNVYRLVSADVYTPVDVTNGVLTEGSSSGIRVVIYTQSGLKYYTNDNTGTNTIQSENIKMNWSDANITSVTGYTSTQNEFQNVYVLHLSSNSGNTNTAAGNYTLFDEDSSNHAFVLAA